MKHPHFGKAHHAVRYPSCLVALTGGGLASPGAVSAFLRDGDARSGPYTDTADFNVHKVQQCWWRRCLSREYPFSTRMRLDVHVVL